MAGICILFCIVGNRRRGGYNYESSSGGHDRMYPAAEPEWFTEGPLSQSDTIELCGFDNAHGDRPRTRNTSGSDDSSRLDGERTKARRRDKLDGTGKPGSEKNKENSSGSRRDVIEAFDATSSTVLNDELHQETNNGQLCMLRCCLFVSVVEMTLPHQVNKLLSDGRFYF